MHKYLCLNEIKIIIKGDYNENSNAFFELGAAFDRVCR